MAIHRNVCTRRRPTTYRGACTDQPTHLGSIRCQKLCAKHQSAEGRRRIVQAIRGRDTRPELLLRQQLRDTGVTGYRVHSANVPGSPDVVIRRAQLAVFVDGVFWHGHAAKFKKIRQAHWKKRIRQNISRDRRVNAELATRGWTVIRVWDIDVLADAARTPARISADVRHTQLSQRRSNLED